MPATSLSLLDRLRRPGRSDAWDRFARLYAPLLIRWAEFQGLRGADAEDLTQTVLVKLLRLLPAYRRAEGQTFRGWLFAVCRNECRDFRSRQATRPLPAAAGLSDVAAGSSTADDPDEAEYRRRLVRRALDLARPDFAPATWTAFVRHVLDGRPAPEVARELGLTANAVYLARHRVLTRVREDLAGLLD